MSDETEQDRYEINILSYATRCTNELERLKAENERLRDQNERQTSVFFDVETALVRDGRWTVGIDGPSVWQRIEADGQRIATLRAERDAAQAREAALREAIQPLANYVAGRGRLWGWKDRTWMNGELADAVENAIAALSQPEPPLLARLKAAERVVEAVRLVRAVLYPREDLDDAWVKVSSHRGDPWPPEGWQTMDPFELFRAGARQANSIGSLDAADKPMRALYTAVDAYDALAARDGGES